MTEPSNNYFQNETTSSSWSTENSQLPLSTSLSQSSSKLERLPVPFPQMLPSMELNTPPPSPIKTKLPSIDYLLHPASMSEEEAAFGYSSGTSDHSPVTPPNSSQIVFNSQKPATYLNPAPMFPPPQNTNPRKHKYRFTLAQAPPELLDKLGLKDIASHSINAKPINHVTNSINNHKIKQRHHPRKNPYPMRAPNKSSDGITLKVDAFKPFIEDPRQLLESNFEKQKHLPEYIISSSVSSSNDESAPSSPKLGPKKLRPKKSKTKREGGPTPTERRRKGNSLARVMADRGLLETSFKTFPSTTVINGEIKPARLPPPPPIEYSQLIKELNELNLDNSALEVKPKITWKGGALSIQHLAHYDQLHINEAYVASTLRLTPFQYLQAKNSLCSASRRYKSRLLPFRKSDAQKLLRIDVNKASKLWEFFHQVNWI